MQEPVLSLGEGLVIPLSHECGMFPYTRCVLTYERDEQEKVTKKRRFRAYSFAYVLIISYVYTSNEFLRII